MAGHALRIERAAISDGARIRGEALFTASSVVGHVEQLETQLALIEIEYSKMLGAVRNELTELRNRLAREAQQAETAAANQDPVLIPVAPAQAPHPANNDANGNGHANDNGHANSNDHANGRTLTVS